MKPWKQSGGDCTRRLIPSLTVSLSLTLVLAGCGPAVRQQPVEQPRAEAKSAGSAVPAGPTQLLVDHAWVKDADTPSALDAQRKAMEALRAKVVAGGAFVAAWNELGVDGTRWHVAEQETYPADVLPEGAQSLPVGAVSPILPGDGGLHLFRILGREAIK